MSAGIIGADPQALRDMASKFDAAAQDLVGTRASVQKWVDRADIWRGTDNQGFVSEWNSTGAVTVNQVASELRRTADILRSNAEAQDSDSAATGVEASGSGLFGGAGTRPGGSAEAGAPEDQPDFWRDFLNASRSLMNEEVAGITVEELTSLLGGIGLPSGPGAALDIALAAPDLVGKLLDPDVPLGETLMSAGGLALDMTGGALTTLGMQSKNPAVMLLGTAYMTMGITYEAAAESDFSKSGIQTAWEYATENPVVVVEEVGKATFQVFRDLGWKITGAFLGARSGL